MKKLLLALTLLSAFAGTTALGVALNEHSHKVTGLQASQMFAQQRYIPAPAFQKLP